MVTKYNIIIADCPFEFTDRLQMSNTKRGAVDQYPVLSLENIKNLPLQEVIAKDALLAFWVPSALLPEGLEIMKKWGFKFKQSFIWVKIKKNPLEKLAKNLKSQFRKKTLSANQIDNIINSFSLNESLWFGMGHTFRNTHEICLIGTRGKILSHLRNKSQRSVDLHSLVYRNQVQHSAKPESLQISLETMFDESLSKLELFARRERLGWTCIGNEIEILQPNGQLQTGEDIRESLDRLSKI